ncbi:hypothetical protein ACHAWX_004242, partial [Stephanocyclus meneghinianus]
LPWSERITFLNLLLLQTKVFPYHWKSKTTLQFTSQIIITMKEDAMDSNRLPHHRMVSSNQQYARRSLSSIRVEDLPPLPFPCGHRPSPYKPCTSSSRHGRPLVNGRTRSKAVDPSGSITSNSEPLTCFDSTFHYDHGNDSPRTPRVSFSPFPQNHNCKSNSQPQAQTRVMNLPWTDVRGNTAAYTGEVNELIQPHGLGHLQYQNGTVHISVWRNGMPVRNPPNLVSSTKEAVENASLKRGLELGDIALPSQIQNASPEDAHDAAASLPVHSFAFVLRSNGQWTYAILADRPVPEGPQASIRFVLDKRGSTKIFKRKYWGMYIRSVRNVNKNENEKHMGNDKCDVNCRITVEKEEVMTREAFQRLESFQKAVRRVSSDLSIRTKDHWG